MDRLARAAGKQAGLARALWWALRGRAAVGPDDVALAYDGLDRAVLWTITVELRFSPAAEVDVDGRTHSHSVERASFAAVDPAAAVTLLRARVATAEH
jgi:hypothetical protein